MKLALSLGIAGLAASREIIGHRGNSGIFPENTNEGFESACQFSDHIECDIQLTKDGQLVCNHDPWLSTTTNVEELFPDRRTVMTVPGMGDFDDWFIKDFTLAEIQLLRKKQDVAGRTKAKDGLYQIPTFGSFLDTALANRVGVYCEIKVASLLNGFLTQIGMPYTIEQIVFGAVAQHPITMSGLQVTHINFEPQSLIDMKALYTATFGGMSSEKYLYLACDRAAPGNPWTPQVLGYLQMNGIDGIGLCQASIHSQDANGYVTAERKSEIEALKNFGITNVNVWTFKNEDTAIPMDFESDPNQHYQFYMENYPDVTGFITDFPKTAKSSVRNYELINNPDSIQAATYGARKIEMPADIGLISGFLQLGVQSGIFDASELALAQGLGTHGCYCKMTSGSDVIPGSTPVNDLDKWCKVLMNKRSCLQLDSGAGAACPGGINKVKYSATFMLVPEGDKMKPMVSHNADFHCQDETDPCMKAVCKVDHEWMFKTCRAFEMGELEFIADATCEAGGNGGGQVGVRSCAGSAPDVFFTRN